jgi:hypothetical protein
VFDGERVECIGSSVRAMTSQGEGLNSPSHSTAQLVYARMTAVVRMLRPPRGAAQRVTRSSPHRVSMPKRPSTAKGNDDDDER